MGCANTPRRSRRSWEHTSNVSVRDALLSSVRDLSIVSEVSERESSVEPLPAQSTPQQRAPGVAWEFPVDTFRIEKPDSTIVSTLPKKRNNKSNNPRRIKATLPGERAEARSQRRSWDAPSQETNGKLTGIRSRVRGAAPDSTIKAKKGSSATSLSKHDVKKLLSISRARQKVIKTRSEDYNKTVRALDAKCSVFRRSPSPSDATQLTEEEVCIIEVQQAAFDRWEKAVDVAKQALEEVMEAEKVLGFAAEFEHMKGLMDTNGADWDVGIDKYIDLYRNLQTEYPETTPIRRSKIIRRQQTYPPRPHDHKTPNAVPKSPMHGRAQSLDESRTATARSRSSIPNSAVQTATPQRFDPSYILSLGRRFAHSAEAWFLKLIYKLVGFDMSHSVYCREDCYRLMESLGKLQNWLLTAKGTTRVDRHDVLLGRLRDTVIRWSSQMFELPLAKTKG